jgi:hypothetical protein
MTSEVQCSFLGGPFDGKSVAVPRSQPLPTVMGFADSQLSGVHLYATNGPTEPGEICTDLELWYEGFNSWEQLAGTCIWKQEGETE